MKRVIRYDPSLLEFARRLTPEDRVRQALCAWRIYHELHHPYDRPWYRGFDSFEEFAQRGAEGEDDDPAPAS